MIDDLFYVPLHNNISFLFNTYLNLYYNIIYHDRHATFFYRFFKFKSSHHCAMFCYIEYKHANVISFEPPQVMSLKLHYHLFCYSVVCLLLYYFLICPFTKRTEHNNA